MTLIVPLNLFIDIFVKLLLSNLKITYDLEIKQRRSVFLIKEDTNRNNKANLKSKILFD